MDPAASVPAWKWAAIFLCVLFSGYFSASETAFVSLSRARLQALIEKRPMKGDMRALWLNNPSVLLTTILIGNNLVNIGASALATDVASQLFHERGVAVAVGVMTFVLLAFGEITPKVLARRFPENLVGSVARGLLVVFWVTWPINRAFRVFTDFLIRLTGGDPARDFNPLREEELEQMVAMSAREGDLSRLSANLIPRVFAFNRRTVKDVMVPRTEMLALEITDGPEEILRQVDRSGHTRYPVYRDRIDEVVGIFHAKNLFSLPREKWGQFRLAERLPKPHYVPESARLGDVLQDLQRRHLHMALVVDEFGGVEGMVTMDDILEELVGEIREAEKGPRRPPMATEVPGRTPLDELRETWPQLHGRLPAKTAGGLIMEITGRVPVPGEKVEALGLRFTVVSSDERRIKKLRIEALGKEKKD